MLVFKNVDVNVTSTLNYNGERLEDVIDAHVAAGGAIPNDIRFNSVTCNILQCDANNQGDTYLGKTNQIKVLDVEEPNPVDQAKYLKKYIQDVALSCGSR